MKIKITITTLFILAIIALIFTIGLILPKQREFVKTAEFKSVPQKVFQIEPKNFNGYWSRTFEPTSKGTKVVFRDVVIIENPFYRVLSSIFVDLDKTMEIYMSNLKTKLGE